MKLFHKLTSAILVLTILAVSAATVTADGISDNFSKKDSYTAGQFSDVSADDWFSENVAAVFEYGLMKGTDSTKFSPSSKVTLAEVITVASRLHSLYYSGEDEFVQGSPWYEVYAEYAEINGICDPYDFGSLTKSASRAQVADILVSALPADELEVINTISTDQIPDVKSSDNYAYAIYTLYKAGVVGGRDIYGTFDPDACITRAEMAAISTRLVDKDLRMTFTLKEKPKAEDKTTKFLPSEYDSTQETIYYFLTIEMGCTPVTACAIMGNIAQECGYNYNSSGSAYGLIQWTGSRKSSLISWCSSNGYSYKSLVGQLYFLRYEMSQSSYKKYIDMMNALDVKESSIAEATDIFLTYVERAGTRVLDKRVRYALEAWEAYGSKDA